MNFEEMDRLDADHPTWALRYPEEVNARYWMYDVHRVRAARRAVRLRRSARIATRALTRVRPG